MGFLPPGPWAELARFGLGLLFTSVAAYLVSRLFGSILPRLASRTRTTLDDTIIPALRLPAVLAVLLAGIAISLHFLTLGNALPYVRKGLLATLVLLGALAISRVVKVLFVAYVQRLKERADGPVDDHVVVLARKALSVAIWGICGLLVVQNLGYDITSVLAGLGIGGLAVALAAKDTIANIFAGLVILTDRPFKIGDRIEFEQYAGVVEELGVRSVRLRADDGALVTVPNTKFVEVVVRNVTRSNGRRVLMDLSLLYGLSAERLEEARQIVLATLASSPSVLSDPAPWVYYQSFGDSAVILRACFYTQIPWTEHASTRSEVMLKIKAALDNAGIGFAYPSITVYAGG